MRVDVKKFLFAGTHKKKDLFFKKAQEAGIIHFSQEKKEPPQELETFIHALKILKEIPAREKNIGSKEPENRQNSSFATTSGDNALSIAQEVVRVKEGIEKLKQEEEKLDNEMAEIAPFGNFSFEDIEYIENKGKRKVRFYFAKTIPPLTHEIILIHSDAELHYFLGFLQEETVVEGLIEKKIERSYLELERGKQEIQKKQASLENRLKNFSKEDLKGALVHSLNEHHLHLAKDSTSQEMEGKLFFVSGFVPLSHLDQLSLLAEETGIYYEEIALETNESVPTFLKNRGLSKLGEDLVALYDTPGQTDKDPSLFVLFAFMLFFSMIIGDAGYGCVLLMGALWLKFFRFPRATGIKKRFLNLSLLLFSSCIVWGVLTTSFFGINIPGDSPFRKIAITHYLAEKKIAYLISENAHFSEEVTKKFPEITGLKDPQEITERIGNALLDEITNGIMVEIALLVGVLHILLSLMRSMDRNKVAFGWCLFIIGGFLYAPEYLQECTLMHYLFSFPQETLEKAGLLLMGSGGAIVIATGIYFNKLKGILEVTTAIQIFADILSYLRLYALGLAGAIVSTTINGFATSSSIFVGPFIFIIGHLVNIVLAIMGGVIHGLRLNFLEWFHYSFDGEGIPFKPLKKITEIK